MEQTFTYTTESIATELNKWRISNYSPEYQEVLAQEQLLADARVRTDFEQGFQRTSQPE